MEDRGARNVKILVGEPNSDVRSGIRALLYQQGYRGVIEVKSCDRLEEEIRSNFLDLIVAATELGNGSVFECIKQVRHNKIGTNPFVPVILVTNDTIDHVVRQALDCGTDHILAKPLSMNDLATRIKALIDARKDFVVTSDYIGPDRRGKARADAQPAPLVQVPNSLRLKQKEYLDSNAVAAAIKNGLKEVNEFRIERHALFIASLVGDIEKSYAEQKGPTTVLLDLDRLIAATEETAGRLNGSRYAHVLKLCATLAEVAQAVKSKVAAPDPKDLRLLPELARALPLACDRERSSPQLVDEIYNQIMGFLKA